MLKYQIPQDETYVYNISSRVLDSFQLMFFDSATVQEITPKLKQQPKVVKPKEETFKPGNNVEYHKLDPHRLNIKKELRGFPKLNEKELEELAGELDNESLSGSEDSDSEDNDEDLYNQKKDVLETVFEKNIQKLEALKVEDDDSLVSHLTNRLPFILFKSNLLDGSKAFGVFKSLFTIKELENPLESIQKWQKSSLDSKSALFMIGGGHFAGAVINHKPKSIKGNVMKPGENSLEYSVDVVMHKSFHRYTTRRKQGGSQSTNDNAHGKANSAGSSLRRANEAALQNEVRKLLNSWKNELNDCESIFIRANGASNRNILIGYEGAVLKNDDVRIKNFPFTTRRATTTELKRAWIQLTYLNVTDIPKIDDKKLKERQAQEQLKLSTIQKTKEQASISDEEKHTKELVGFLKKSRGPVLITYLKKHKLSGNFELKPKALFYSTPTLLHYASAHGIKNLISPLIKTAKADPTIQNPNKKTAYEIAANKATRQAFQVTRHELGESFTDWDAAKIGEAISRDVIEKEEEEHKVKEEQLKKELIQKELQKNNDHESDNATPRVPAPRLGGVLVSQVNMNTLSDEQRIRLMREQRARAAEARIKAQAS